MNQENAGVMFGLYRLFYWIALLAYLNLLWILFSVLGLGLLGIGPATLATYSIIRNQLQGKKAAPIGMTFYRTFKNQFWLGNKLFFVTFAGFLFIYLDFAVIRALPHQPVIDYLVIPALIILSVLWLLISCYVYAIQTHYHLKFWQIFKDAFWISGIFPLSSVGIVFIFIIGFIIIYFVPAVIPLYLISVPVFVVQLIALYNFKKIEAMKSLEKTNNIE